jgi:hypothetical protein
MVMSAWLLWCCCCCCAAAAVLLRLLLLLLLRFQGYLHDTASPFAHQVVFTIYTIQDTSRSLGGSWRTKGGSRGSTRTLLDF